MRPALLLALALLTGCAVAARPQMTPRESAAPEPTPALPDDSAEQADVESQLDHHLEATPVLDCPEAQRLRDEICRLADRICALTPPSCDPARTRCTRARAKVAPRCR